MALSTTTTSYSSSPTATAPVLAFPTPFPQPASCSSQALTTTVISREGYAGKTTSYTYQVADKSDPRYTACIAPAGDQFTFSPAVCPQGWPAWYLGTASSGVTTAYCCAPGYSMGDRPATTNPSPSCSHEFPFNPDSWSSTEDVPRQATLPAWHITWQSTDLPTMSPKPPAIEGERIIKWVPGSDPERELPRPSSGSSGSSEGQGPMTALAIGMIITLPVLLFLGMCFGFTACCSRGNRGWSRGLRATPAPAPAPAAS